MSHARWIEGERAWGDHEPAPLDVAIGPWRFELRGDELADLGFDGSTVARSVRAVARDRDWNTVPARVESFEQRPDGADLLLAMRGYGADIRARMEVRVDERRFAVRLVATSRTEFESSRLGLVVLHQPELAGADLVIGTPEGEVRRTVFPVDIAPHQPAKDIRTLAWSHDGVATEVRFEGDVFEMEDQRNWTDASYKTYSTPLSRPFPVTIAAGAVIEQSAAFTARRVGPPASGASSDDPVVVELVPTHRRVPDVTLGASTVPDAEWVQHPLPSGVSAVLVELDARTASWRAALDRARREAGVLPLDVRITAADPADVRAVVEGAAAAGPVARLGVFAERGHVSEEPLWRALADAASRAVPDAELVGGARSHFTELNRRHGELPAELPGLAFSLTPQMHATERAQLTESIPVQAAVVRNALRIAAGRPLHVGPITLRSRFNTVATDGSGEDADRGLADGYGAHLVEGATDGRQASEAVRAWTVASFAAICTAAIEGGEVAGVDYFETFGPRGIRGIHGPFPVAEAIASIASIRGRDLLAPEGALPDGVHLVAAIDPDGSWRAFVANLSERTTTLVLRRDDRDHEVTVAPYRVEALERAAMNT